MIRAAVLALTLVLAGVPVSAAPVPAQTTLFAHQTGEWHSAYQAKDWAWMGALYAPDAWLMTDGAPTIVGRVAIVAYLRGYAEMGAAVSYAYSNERTRIEGRWATTTADYQMTAQLPGKAAIVSKGRVMRISQRSGGKWLIWREMDNTLPRAKP